MVSVFEDEMALEIDCELASDSSHSKHQWLIAPIFRATDAYEGQVNDPITLNRYLYANGDPVDGSDPTGHEDIGDILLTTGISATLGATFLGVIAPAGQHIKWAITGATSGLLAGSALAYAFGPGAITNPELPAKVILSGIATGFLNDIGIVIGDYPNFSSKHWNNYALGFVQGFGWGAATEAFGDFLKQVPGLNSWLGGDESVSNIFLRSFVIGFTQSALSSTTRAISDLFGATDSIDPETLGFWEDALGAALSDGAKAASLAVYKAGVGQAIDGNLTTIETRLGDNVYVRALVSTFVGFLSAGPSSLFSKLHDWFLPS